MNGRVQLVGAGPGDPELLTLKAVRALNEADVVLYDALVNKEIFSHCTSGVKRVFVGKRAGMKVYNQLEINHLILYYALKGKAVVRLKGGDPTVFGRCYEEVDFLEERGVKVDIIPGVSSALGIAAGLKLPITKRGVSSSFWVVTATDLNDEASSDLSHALEARATIVVLMGRRRLRHIAEKLVAYGKSDMPIAVVEKGTTEQQKTVVGTAADIADVADRNNIGTPAIIIIGDTVSHMSIHQTLTNFEHEHQSTISRLHKTG